MSVNLIEIDGVKRPLMEWARIAGITRGSIYVRMKQGMGIKEAIFAPKQNTWQSVDEHDTATDALVESGEPDRRAIVYGMVCCGTTDTGIVERTGYDPAEVARYRGEMPGWWGLDMRRHKESHTAREGKK